MLNANRLNDNSNRNYGCSLTSLKANPIDHESSFMDRYQQNVDANRNINVPSATKMSECYKLSDISNRDFLCSFYSCFTYFLLEIEIWGRKPIIVPDQELTMLQDLFIDKTLKNSFLEQKKRNSYSEMQFFRKQLPSYKMRKELSNLIASNQVVVISGETGCGKTTQVPQFILDDALEKGKGSTTKIVCTQPRRIAAISVSERVASERGERLGRVDSSVGYQIRLDKKLPRIEGGSILFCTTGIVLEMLARGKGSKCLREVSHLIIDEVHERDMNTDFLMAIIKDTLKKRPDFRLILMSATLNAETFSQYFNAPSTNIPGFTYPVKELYLEDVLEWTKFRIQPDIKTPGDHKTTKKGKSKQYTDFIKPFLSDMTKTYSRSTIQSLSLPSCEDINIKLIATLIHHINERQKEGAILVFLPGWNDISELNKMLTKDSQYQFKDNDSVEIYPLHSMMPTIDQKNIFDKPPKGVRKIVIATSIAETSITIDDVVYVIDAGKIKYDRYNAHDNISTLKPEWVSLANARQRRGRAGRVQPGICYHLFSRARETTMDHYAVPEMLRTRLDEVILKIKILELGKSKPFLAKVLDPPHETHLQRAIEMLIDINALKLEKDNEILTPLGYHLAKLPMDPQTGKMILFGAIFSCLDPILSVAASLNFKDPCIKPLGKEQLVDQKRLNLSKNSMSDHLMLANAISGWEDAVENGEGRSYCWDNFLSESTLRMLCTMKRQFMEHLYNSKFVVSKNVKSPDSNRNSHNEALIRSVICAGLYPNVARIDHIAKWGAKLSTLNEKNVNIHSKSVNIKAKDYQYRWLVYYEKLKTSGVNLMDCGMVSPLALIFFGKHMKLGIKKRKGGPTIKTIKVDNFISFDCDHFTATMIERLRKDLDRILESKIKNPGISSWDKTTYEGAVLLAIVKLLSSGILGCNDYTIDDDEDTRAQQHKTQKQKTLF